MRVLLFILALLAVAAPLHAAPFDQYQLIMWQERSPEQIAGLKRLGFTGLKLTAANGRIDPAQLASVRASGLPWYLENLASDVLSPYHRYFPDKPVTALFDAAKLRLRGNPADTGVFVRAPSLSDLSAYRSRLETVVRDHARDRPLFYNLADEAGIGDLAAAWDADIGPDSLAGMRLWLRTEYADLGALNRQWGTSFADWDSVVPELTDAALRRPDLNFSAWADFKAWMDVAFARAVRAGTDAVHWADPAGLAGLEGAQIPGWGGYDYSLLAPGVDVMEVGDSGNAMQLARAFNPGLILLRTGGGTGPREIHAAWRHLLLGGRGTIVWDEANDVVDAHGSALPRGKAISGLTNAMRAVAPALFVSTPAMDPVAVLVSQASFRTRWILDRRGGDVRWWDRDAAREYEDNAWAAARRQIFLRLEEIGVQPHVLSSPALETGALRRDGIRVLILPHAIALSDRELDEVATFRRGGGTVLADTEPALFDQHSRRRPAPPLASIVAVPEAMLQSGGPDSPEALLALAALLRAAHVVPRAALFGPDGQPAAGVAARWLRYNTGFILALQAVAPWSAPAAIEVRLAAPALVGDMRVGGPQARKQAFAVKLDPVAPTILSVRP